MTDEFYSGNWEGYYSYGPGYNEARQKIKVGFFIKMVLQEEVLSGTCEELITKVHMGQPAVLSGKIDGSKIHFIKQYPYFFEFNGRGDIEINKSRVSHPIYYTGTFDQVLGIFTGEWKIGSPSGGDGDPFSGNWEMWKI
ncbi:MAG: hypothetical protein J0H74_11685 [Chitinophagaceae bacterium]|nr:hypothetical protein [Chitinophagaceae bacterium]